MQTKIKRLEVSNFRNIESAKYDLTDKVAISGKNFIGKSNSLQAIHWLLSDYLMGGSQDIQSIKPLDDTTKEVSVKVTLDDDTTIQKTYAENWVKTRGTDEITLQGHTTTYFINGIKQSKIGDAVAQIRARLGLDNYFPKSKIDSTRLLINPLYLVEQIDWKILRNYIIELVGDVSDEDVIISNSLFVPLRQPLSKFMGKTDNIISHYKGQLKACKGEIYKCEVLIDELKKIDDVTEDDLAEAKVYLKSIDEKLAELNIARSNQKNPRLNEIDLEIARLTELKNESISNDRENYENSNKEVQKLIKVSTANKSEINDKINELRFKKSELESSINYLNIKIKANQDAIDSNQAKIKNLRNEYSAVAHKEFKGWELPKVDNCPHCGGVLNDDVLAKAKEQLEKSTVEFDTEKKAQLEKIVADGNKLKLETQNLEFGAVDLHTELRDKTAQLEKFMSIEDLQTKVKKLDDEIYELNCSIKPYVNSDKTNEIISQIVSLKEERVIESSKNLNESIDAQINELVMAKEEHQETVNLHNYYVNTQKQIKTAIDKKTDHQKELTDSEIMLALTEEFIRTKLDLLDKNVASVFGEIKFKLIENNIKEGSYNEVCYPLILGKDTPYANGSTSEKIITGVAIVEAIRKHLGLPELPLIFDEAESLDSETLVSRLNTNCQIITARVDDRFKKPTVMNL